MSQNHPSPPLPAPCIIDSGLVIDRTDIQRLLRDLGYVRYVHTLEGTIQSQGEGWIVEVFTDPHQATLVANHSLYINVNSFDYLQLHPSPEGGTCFDLVQDSRRLQIVPLSDGLQDRRSAGNLDAETLETMVAQVLSAKWDVQLDGDEEDYPF